VSAEDRFTVYQDGAGEWRWRKTAANGEPIADSGESYTRQHDAERAAQREDPDAELVVEES
jgi:uncharacterized protein YegP (UPF0339 family)